jgi:hypothetical protein
LSHLCPAITACAVENLDTDYKNRNIYILSDSQVAITALGKYQITIQLAGHNRVQLIWVPGHEGTAGNEITDLLKRTGSEHLFTRPEPACGISIGVVKRAGRVWMNRNHIKQWESTIGLKQVKGLTSGPLPEEQRIC